MTLRKRLFLTIGTLFFIAFIVSFYLENYLTKSHLEDAEKYIEEKIETINEKRRRSIEDYLTLNLAITQAQNRAILDRLNENPLLRKGFDEAKGTWLDSSTLLVTNKILDLVEVTKGDSLSSLIILDPDASVIVDVVEEYPNFSTIAYYDEEKKQWLGPFIGFSLEFSEIISGEKKAAFTWKHVPEFWIIFDPSSMQEFKADTINRLDIFLNPIEPFLNWNVTPDEQSSIRQFLEKMEKAKEFVAKNPSIVSQNGEAWIQWQQKRKPLPPKETDYYVPFDFENEVKYIEEKELKKLEQIGMIWSLSTLFAGGAFGDTPFDSKAPIGVAQIKNGQVRGSAILSRHVFFQKPLQEIAGKEPNPSLPLRELSKRRLMVFLSPKDQRIFFGNSIDFSKSAEQDVLTIAVDGDRILQQLALVTNQTTVFISDNEVIRVFDADASVNNEKDWKNLPTQKLQEQKSGTIVIDGTKYYFLHMEPIKGLDFHFFIFNPEQKEFFLIHALQNATSKLIKTISLHMRLAAIGALIISLLILNKIAKRITKPITHLAKVTDAVGKGKLDAIQFPELSRKPTDEVYKLYHAFYGMVEGLKEKEKVRGVLNKVVSQEIAEEILKKSIHLGGEEKDVTVLFADIRNFSGISEKMDPKQVIGMLNACMTKVSEKIDEFDGVIDKYVGDEVMALFGAPLEKPDSALQSIKCGLAIVDALHQWNEERKKEGLVSIEMGIGIHTGLVVCGNMGAENRLNYTVLGANVNLAARLCEIAKPMQILVSQSTLDREHIKDQFEVQPLSPVTPKGFTEPMNVYEVKRKT